MTNNNSVHTGHRQRLKKRFMEEGFDSFEEHEVLELLLFYCLPRQDTNPIAHELLRQFGSLPQVMSTPVSELTKIKGLGENAAIFLSLMNGFSRYYYSRRDKDPIILDSTQKYSEHLVPLFHASRNEMVYILCLDAKGKLLRCKKIGEGSVNSAAVPIRRIVETALNANATTVVLAHNHPSGLALPSPEDELTTRQLAAALSAVDIILADHLIVADGDYVSLWQSGIYHPNDCHFLI